MSVYATIYMAMDEQSMAAWCDNFHAYPTNDPEERAPLAYGGSAVLPQADDERKGSFSVCAIPAHVRFNRERKEGPEPEGWEPYVRVGIQQETLGEGYDVVLDEDQVRALHATLGAWLEVRSDGRGERG